MSKRKFLKTFPYALLLAYVIFVSWSFINIQERQKEIIDNPAHVLQYARDIHARLGEMRHTLPALFATPSLSYESMVNVLVTQENKQDQSLELISNILGPGNVLVVNLKEALKKIRVLRREAARELVGNADYSRSMQVYEKVVIPQVKVVDNATRAIIDSAKEMLAASMERTRRDMWFNIIISTIVGLFVGQAFYLVNRRASRQTEELLQGQNV